MSSRLAITVAVAIAQNGRYAAVGWDDAQAGDRSEVARLLLHSETGEETARVEFKTFTVQAPRRVPAEVAS